MAAPLPTQAVATFAQLETVPLPLDLPDLVSPDILLTASGGPTLTTFGGALGPALPPSTGLAQMMAHQIVSGLPKPISDLGAGTLEIALDPPELGRVRLSLTEVAGVMTLSIFAERPETIEIMRRHLDILAQEFSREGLDAPNVEIGGGAQREQDPKPTVVADDVPSETEPLEHAATRHTATAAPSDRALDLRL